MSEMQVEVDVRNEGGKVIVEGKTVVPFRTFVTLILQRKVQALFKQCQEEPVIVSSDLLTRLASAPSDAQEDRAKLVLMSVITGTFVGIFITTALFLALSVFNIEWKAEHLGVVLGAFVIVILLGWTLQRTQGTSMKQKIFETMEKVTDTFSK